MRGCLRPVLDHARAAAGAVLVSIGLLALVSPQNLVLCKASWGHLAVENALECCRARGPACAPTRGEAKVSPSAPLPGFAGDGASGCVDLDLDSLQATFVSRFEPVADGHDAASPGWPDAFVAVAASRTTAAPRGAHCAGPPGGGAQATVLRI